MKNILRKALLFARDHHKGQLYNDAEFMYHPILTAQLVEMVAPDDKNLIAAAYLHDVVENCDVSFHDLELQFNEDVASLVREVTKTGYNTFPHLKTRRGYVLKFADRLANLAHIKYWDEVRQTEYLDKSIFWKI